MPDARKRSAKAPSAAPAERPGGISKANLATDKLLQGLSNAESKNVAALAFSAQQIKVDRIADKNSARNWRIATILTLIGVVGFVVGNIYIRRYQYPQLFQWYDKMRKENIQGKYTPNATMYQVTTTMQFQPVAWLVNFTTVWKYIDRTGCEFLAQCVQIKGRGLTALHWAGVASQTKASSLMGPNGWASTGDCNSEGGHQTTMQNNLINNWYRSRNEGNIWYPIFPDPKVNPTAFLNSCMMKELWSPGGTTCGIEAWSNSCGADFKESTIYRLFDGGLCRIASEQTDKTQSATDLFNYIFNEQPEVPADCAASYASGALSGATGAASSMLGLAAVATGPAFFIAAIGLTAGSAIAGSFVGGAAAKQSCENKAKTGLALAALNEQDAIA